MTRSTHDEGDENKLSSRILTVWIVLGIYFVCIIIQGSIEEGLLMTVAILFLYAIGRATYSLHRYTARTIQRSFDDRVSDHESLPPSDAVKTNVQFMDIIDNY